MTYIILIDDKLTARIPVVVFYPKCKYPDCVPAHIGSQNKI